MTTNPQSNTDTDEENVDDLDYLEGTLMEMFKRNHTGYKNSQYADTRREMMALATDLTASILEVRRQRMIEGGDIPPIASQQNLRRYVKHKKKPSS